MGKNKEGWETRCAEIDKEVIRVEKELLAQLNDIKDIVADDSWIEAKIKRLS